MFRTSTVCVKHHVGKFADFLRLEVYQYYGKSPRDRHLTIDQMRTDALSRAKEKRGIGGATLNRHLTFLGQIFHHASSRGVEALSGINLVAVHAKGKKQRARDERPKLAIEKVEAVFLTPPFNNCAGWNALEEAGPAGVQQIFHCALYFVPIFILHGLPPRGALRSDGRRRDFQ
jgi:hypothetical protein